MRYNGYTVKEASKSVGFTRKTGYCIQNSWNINGIDGLVPIFNCGHRSKLTDGQKSKLIN
jgi:transposase